MAISKTQLLSDLKSDDWELALMAARQLGIRRDTSAIPDLINALRGPDEWVAIEAARALGKLKTETAIPALAEALAAKELSQQYRDELNTAKANNDALAGLAAIEYMGNDLRALRVESAAALAKIGCADARKALEDSLDYLDDKDTVEMVEHLLAEMSPEKKKTSAKQPPTAKQSYSGAAISQRAAARRARAKK